MGHFMYPEIWSELNQVPSARASFLDYVHDISCWNDDNSTVKKDGADNIIGFIFDQYNMQDDTGVLVGELIFVDEEEHVRRFVDQFEWFIDEWLTGQPNIDGIHDSVLPDSVIDAAKSLQGKLRERGVPKYVQDGEENSGG